MKRKVFQFLLDALYIFLALQLKIHGQISLSVRWILAEGQLLLRPFNILSFSKCFTIRLPYDVQSCLYVPPSVRPRAPVSRTLPPVGVRQKLEQQSARRFSGVLPNAGLTGNLSLKSNASMGTITRVQRKLEIVNQSDHKSLKNIVKQPRYRLPGRKSPSISLPCLLFCCRYIILSYPELPLTFAYPTPEFPTPNFEYHTAFDGVVFGTMVKTRKFVEGNSTLTTKAVWDDELTLIFCELCVNKVNAGNRPTTHLNSKGWENVVALFQAKTQKNYGKPQLKNKWDTLKKEWRLWRELLKDSTGIGWCPSKRTVDATEEWWAKKIQENPDFKGFKKKGIEPRLNDLIWQMFGGIVATGENAWAPSSGVFPSGVPMGDDTPNEGFGDSDENSN
ncbi:hypothetical protein GOBAR_AA35424 [Gossypium barbadense]|uniref:Myb/SANT-like domain-containing protein n=1 Tax=Gossypium barbadense TaxID=3634 RepID=A0A2P5W2G0_GOSBA|nr:hypothetical protein GOBAR_AA35424 [Gossypium barbadense]